MNKPVNKPCKACDLTFAALFARESQLTMRVACAATFRIDHGGSGIHHPRPPHCGGAVPACFRPRVNWERIALKWRDIAERRRDHHLDLYKSGRWKHYYTDEEFLDRDAQAVAIADRWAVIAPRSGEREVPAAIEQPAAA